ncbi:general secretion pathway protein GspB [Alkalimonas sp. MEB108]|uniref:General secretion pathway protein GspB n=1 Tax=Alkalimonas cellulosilytica TaxID=3058395 RepID=A0ABU7J867_9GAMM|nr:general secretion pathway protein GspB [Alkalimonas sp. MEB108]MEE2002445.1 general secretion pathway protein GspB [Alkalimonas sp. MEB108]
MSILMDALKQQQNITASTAVSGRVAPFWLGVLAGAAVLSLALAAGYWLGTKQSSVAAAVPAQQTEPATVASQQQILAALSEVPVATRSDAAASEEAAAAEPAVVSQSVPAEPEPMNIAAEPEARPARPSMPSLDELEATEVSAELQQRFSQVMDELEQFGQRREQVRVHDAPARDISELAPQVQHQLPPMRFEAHVFASVPSRRWVKVNGRTLQQGQWLSTDIQVVEIHPNHVVLRYRQQEFSMAALSEWPG